MKKLLSLAILANKAYQFIINGNVLEDAGNLTIVVAPIEVGGAEQIYI